MVGVVQIGWKYVVAIFPNEHAELILIEPCRSTDYNCWNSSGANKYY